MSKETIIKIFEDKNIRVLWDEESEDWFFSIIDVVAVLTNNDFQGARNYWKVLKHRLKEEGNETVTNCNQLKLKAQDGKYRLTDVADTKQLLRLVQTIPSKRAEPFKLWLAEVGKDRIDEIADPELTINRALETYKKKGYSQSWINQRLKSIEIRKDLTNEWEKSGVNSPKDFAILSSKLTKLWSDLSVKEYKKLKGLKKENLRDNMSNLELVFNMLAEVSTTEISRLKNPNLFEENLKIIDEGGIIAKSARLELEKKWVKKLFQKIII